MRKLCIRTDVGYSCQFTNFTLSFYFSADYEIIARQGCYSEDLSNREFNRSIAFDEGTLQPPFCTSSCHLLGYDYAVSTFIILILFILNFFFYSYIVVMS